LQWRLPTKMTTLPASATMGRPVCIWPRPRQHHQRQ
jgi:hypothetical protein